MFYGYFEKSRYGTVRTIGLENYDKSRGIRYGTGQVLQIPSRAQPWNIFLIICLFTEHGRTVNDQFRWIILTKMALDWLTLKSI